MTIHSLSPKHTWISHTKPSSTFLKQHIVPDHQLLHKIKRNGKLKRKDKKGYLIRQPQSAETALDPKEDCEKRRSDDEGPCDGSICCEHITKHLNIIKTNQKGKNFDTKETKGVWKMNTPDDYLARERELTHWNQMGLRSSSQWSRKQRTLLQSFSGFSFFRGLLFAVRIASCLSFSTVWYILNQIILII